MLNCWTPREAISWEVNFWCIFLGWKITSKIRTRLHEAQRDGEFLGVFSRRFWRVFWFKFCESPKVSKKRLKRWESLLKTRRFCFTMDLNSFQPRFQRKHLLFKHPANRYCWVRCEFPWLWYPEAQAAKDLGYLFLKTPWWFQFSLALLHLRSYGKRWVKFLLKKASRWSHFSDNFGHWKVSSEKGGPLGVLQNTGSFTFVGPPKHPLRNSRNWKPRNPHLPTSRLQRTHILPKKCHEGKGCQYGKQKHPASSGGDLVKVMKSNVIIKHSCQIDELWIRCIFDMHMDGKWNWHTTGMELGTMCF